MSSPPPPVRGCSLLILCSMQYSYSWNSWKSLKFQLWQYIATTCGYCNEWSTCMFDNTFSLIAFHLCLSPLLVAYLLYMYATTIGHSIENDGTKIHRPCAVKTNYHVHHTTQCLPHQGQSQRSLFSDVIMQNTPSTNGANLAIHNRPQVSLVKE